MSSEPYAIPPKDRAFEGILWYIKHYDLQSGDRLPAERVLCEELGVSRTALRAAITRLISCGTLESRRGSGTYVCPPKPLNIFQETWNYTQAVERVGSKSTARLVWSKVVYADIDHLYRLEHAYELEDTGIFDVLGYEGACLLEWGEQFQDELTDEYLSVTLKRDEGDSDVRTITLEAHGDRAMELSHLIDRAVQDELA